MNHLPKRAGGPFLSKLSLALLAALAVAVTPLILIGLAILEEELFHTGILGEVYKSMGILAPLKALYDFLAQVF